MGLGLGLRLEFDANPKPYPDAAHVWGYRLDANPDPTLTPPRLVHGGKDLLCELLG